MLLSLLSAISLLLLLKLQATKAYSVSPQRTTILSPVSRGCISWSLELIKVCRQATGCFREFVPMVDIMPSLLFLSSSKGLNLRIFQLTGVLIKINMTVCWKLKEANFLFMSDGTALVAVYWGRWNNNNMPCSLEIFICIEFHFFKNALLIIHCRLIIRLFDLCDYYLRAGCKGLRRGEIQQHKVNQERIYIKLSNVI